MIELGSENRNEVSISGKPNHLLQLYQKYRFLTPTRSLLHPQFLAVETSWPVLYLLDPRSRCQLPDSMPFSF